NCIKGSLTYRVGAKFKGPNVNTDHARAWKGCEFSVGCIEAGNIKIAVVKLFVIRITECAQRRGLIAFERDDSAVEHRSGFLGCPELLGPGQVSGKCQRQCRKYSHGHCITHSILA